MPLQIKKPNKNRLEVGFYLAADFEFRLAESLDLRREALFFLIVLPFEALSRALKTLGSRLVALSIAFEATDFLNSLTADL